MGDEYVHRIGRTGRLGNLGKATSFYDAEGDADVAGPLVKILAAAGTAVPDWLEEVETMMRSGREEILGEEVEKFEVLRCPSRVCRMTNLQRMLFFFVSVIPLCTII